MNAEIKALWIADLRSGKHKQTTGLLQSRRGFCCLGRLCELAVEAGVIPKPVSNGPWEEYDGEGSVLPNSVMKWAELETATAHYGVGHPNKSRLSEDNDKGKTFAEIADIIEREF